MKDVKQFCLHRRDTENSEKWFFVCREVPTDKKDSRLPGIFQQKAKGLREESENLLDLFDADSLHVKAVVRKGRRIL